jgi:hypothetical protein
MENHVLNETKIKPRGNIFLGIFLLIIAVFCFFESSALSIYEYLIECIIILASIKGLTMSFSYNDKEFTLHSFLFLKRKILLSSITNFSPGIEGIYFIVSNAKRILILSIGAKNEIKKFAAVLKQQNPSCIVNKRLLVETINESKLL